jgi:hypothetical protein
VRALRWSHYRLRDMRKHRFEVVHGAPPVPKHAPILSPPI